MSFFKKLLNSITGDTTKETDNQAADSEEEQSTSSTNKALEYTVETDAGEEIDITQIPEPLQGMSDEEILTKLSDITLKYQELEEDESYLKSEGFENEDHFMAFMDYFREECWKKSGKQGLDVLGHETITIQEERMRQTEAMTGAGELLEPVEGVTCQTWATINAGIASGKALESLLTEHSLDNALWEKVNTEWMDRMTKDTSHRISQVYGDAFNASATGNMGGKEDINACDLPFEKYMEISVALDKHHQDPQAVLDLFGMNPVDWSNASAFWGHQMNLETEHYYHEETRLRKIYEEKYKAGTVQGGINF